MQSRTIAPALAVLAAREPHCDGNYSAVAATLQFSVLALLNVKLFRRGRAPYLLPPIRPELWPMVLLVPVVLVVPVAVPLVVPVPVPLTVPPAVPLAVPPTVPLFVLSHPVTAKAMTANIENRNDFIVNESLQAATLDAPESIRSSDSSLVTPHR